MVVKRCSESDTCRRARGISHLGVKMCSESDTSSRRDTVYRGGIGQLSKLWRVVHGRGQVLKEQDLPPRARDSSTQGDTISQLRVKRW